MAIIGAREPTPYGRETTRHLAKGLSEAGVQIISGMAKGVDRYAHEGALMGGGGTFSVLGCGVDCCYPRENIELYMEICRNGGHVSEYDEGILPTPGHFPMRNRIISGMSDAVLVVEAREKSGSLITADMALEQGRDVYAVPGRLGDALSEGTNNLLKMGAYLVDGVECALELLGRSAKVYRGFTAERKKNKKITLETNEKMVYDCLGLEPKHINEVVNETGFSLMEVSEILLQLELEQLAGWVTGDRYVAY